MAQGSWRSATSSAWNGGPTSMLRFGCCAAAGKAKAAATMAKAEFASFVRRMNYLPLGRFLSSYPRGRDCRSPGYDRA